MEFDWDIVVNGVEAAVQGYNLKNSPWLGVAAGGAIGGGAVVLADNVVSSLMSNPDKEKTLPEAALNGTIESTIKAFAMSLLLAEPLTMETVGMAVLYGIPEEVIIHSLEGELDWQNALGWN